MILAAFALTAADPLPVNAIMPASAEQILAAHRDKSRVLLVFAPTAQDASYVEQTKLWQNEKAQFDDRQLVVLPVFGDAPSYSAAVEKKYGIAPNSFTLILIGKDGHDAYRADKPLKPERLYEVIDAMPMRKAEMRRARSKANRDE